MVNIEPSKNQDKKLINLTSIVVLLEAFENLDMARDLFPIPFYPSVTTDEMRNVFIPPAGLGCTSATLLGITWGLLPP